MTATDPFRDCAGCGDRFIPATPTTEKVHPVPIVGQAPERRLSRVRMVRRSVQH